MSVALGHGRAPLHVRCSLFATEMVQCRVCRNGQQLQFAAHQTASLFGELIDDISWNDFRIEAENLWVARINRDPYPMGVGIAEGFDPREVLKQSIGFLLKSGLSIRNKCVSPWRNATGLS